MQIKYKKSLKDYKYLIMFDLASKVTGVCLYDLINNKPIKTYVLKVKGINTSPVIELYEILGNFFEEINKSGFLFEEVLVSFEAMPTQMHSSFTTIQTFLALAKAHATIDLFLSIHNIDVYDDVGVYPASTHAYFKKIVSCNKDEKITKELIRDYVVQSYPHLEMTTLDESDAVFLSKTFVESKWNKDLDEKIKELKRHKKTLKANHAILKVEEEIKQMQDYKN